MQQTQQQHTTVTEDDRDFSVTVRQDDDTGRWQPSISENGWEWEGDIPDFATAGEALTWARRMIAEQVQEDAASNAPEPGHHCPFCGGAGCGCCQYTGWE